MSWYTMISIEENSRFVICLKCDDRIEAYTAQKLQRKKKAHKGECRIARKLEAVA